MIQPKIVSFFEMLRDNVRPGDPVEEEGMIFHPRGPCAILFDRSTLEWKLQLAQASISGEPRRWSVGGRGSDRPSRYLVVRGQQQQSPRGGNSTRGHPPVPSLGRGPINTRPLREPASPRRVRQPRASTRNGRVV